MCLAYGRALVITCSVPSIYGRQLREGRRVNSTLPLSQNELPNSLLYFDLIPSVRSRFHPQLSSLPPPVHILWVVCLVRISTLAIPSPQAFTTHWANKPFWTQIPMYSIHPPLSYSTTSSPPVFYPSRSSLSKSQRPREELLSERALQNDR